MSPTLSSLFLPLKSRNVLLVSCLITLLYLGLQIYFFNIILINATIIGEFTLSYKLTLLTQLFTGYFATIPLSQAIFTVITSLLVGVNGALMIALIQRVKASSDSKLTFGGTGLLALASTGCPSCGITLLSFLGPASSTVAIALHNSIIQVAIIGILVTSVLYSLVRLQRSLICRI